MFKKILEGYRNLKDEDIKKENKKTSDLNNNHVVIYDNFRPIVVDHDTDKLEDAFGIHKDRVSYLKILISEKSRFDRNSEWIDYVAKGCSHPNELTFCLFIIGALSIKERKIYDRD